MKKLILALLLTAPLMAQVPVSPIVQPHPSFFDITGLACNACSLYSYAAGSTTPQATYTDSTGTSQNTNPVIMGADGGPLTPGGTSGAIWMGPNAYKFVLIDASGNTVFTVDNVSGGGAFPCGPANAIQIANSSVTGFSCDPNITINTAAHLLNVGTLGPNYVTIGALGTATTWTFDTTTPETALASIGGAATNSGTINQLAYYATAGTTLSATSSIPTGITGTTQSPSDNSTKLATTAYVALPGAINPTGVQVGSGMAMTGNQGNGTLVQHSTGTAASGNCAEFDANGNVVDSGTICGGSGSQKNCLSVACAGGMYSANGGTYTNSSSVPVLEEVTATLAGSSGTGGQYQVSSTIGGLTGPSGEIGNACGNNPPAPITFIVPPLTSFTVTPTVVSTCSPAGTWAITSWIEVAL